MAKTKEKILESSLLLFNQNGLKQTTLQTIADAIQISVGNLAYHYKNKNEIVAVHALDLEEQLQECLGHYRNYPGLIDFQIQLGQILLTIKKFQYLFINLGDVRQVYPEAFAIIQTFAQKLTTQIESRLEYQQEQQNIEPIDPECLVRLAQSICSQILLTENTRLLFSDTSSFVISLWELLSPYFTEQGQQEWQQQVLPALKN
ncbi:MAG: TetR/AcrR family transcriptional regulator [Bacteroidota bacterium]